MFWDWYVLLLVLYGEFAVCLWFECVDWTFGFGVLLVGLVVGVDVERLVLGVGLELWVFMFWW